MDTYLDMENLILRYLAGETSEQEARQMQEWLQANEENRQLFAAHKKLWLETGKLAGYNANQVKQGKEKTDLKIRNSELQQSFEHAKRRIRILAYAASVSLLLGIGSFLYMWQKGESAEQPEALSGVKIEVPYGSKALTTLPDGSKVWVNAGSKITYAADFGITSRDVYLTGEAYFDIAKNEKIPFYVNTDVLKIKVFGTAFNVKAYSDDDRVETTLDRGSISIIRNNELDGEIKMEPGQ
ncbi:MAG: FecR family protein, partial [Tannerella sp.]|nr:FecR family protein [Tannerella sp.]